MQPREKSIRNRTCHQLLGLIQDDMDGGEYLMKEVWEFCQDDEDDEIVYYELQEIMDLLRTRVADRETEHA